MRRGSDGCPRTAPFHSGFTVTALPAATSPAAVAAAHGPLHVQPLSVGSQLDASLAVPADWSPAGSVLSLLSLSQPGLPQPAGLLGTLGLPYGTGVGMLSNGGLGMTMAPTPAAAAGLELPQQLQWAFPQQLPPLPPLQPLPPLPATPAMAPADMMMPQSWATHHSGHTPAHIAGAPWSASMHPGSLPGAMPTCEAAHMMAMCTGAYASAPVHNGLSMAPMMLPNTAAPLPMVQGAPVGAAMQGGQHAVHMGQSATMAAALTRIAEALELLRGGGGTM